MTITNDYFTRLVSEERSMGLREEAQAYRLARMIGSIRTSARALRSRGGPRRPAQIPRQREHPSAEQRTGNPELGSKDTSVDLLRCAA